MGKTARKAHLLLIPAPLADQALKQLNLQSAGEDSELTYLRPGSSHRNTMARSLCSPRVRTGMQSRSFLWFLHNERRKTSLLFGNAATSRVGTLLRV